MRLIIIGISLTILATNLLGHKKKTQQFVSSQADTAFIIVPLRGVDDNKILVLEVGQKASIHESGDSILYYATKYLSNNLVKDKYWKIKTFLDSAFNKADTVSIGFTQLSHLEYLVAQQLQEGNAKVFYKKQNSFVDTISHRFERFGGHGDRFFYMPDQRPFFAVIEITGILDNDALLSGKYYQAYVKEGEKLASLRLR